MVSGISRSKDNLTVLLHLAKLPTRKVVALYPLLQNCLRGPVPIVIGYYLIFLYFNSFIWVYVTLSLFPFFCFLTVLNILCS